MSTIILFSSLLDPFASPRTLLVLHISNLSLLNLPVLTPRFRPIRISPPREHRLGPAFHQKRSRNSCQSAWGGNAHHLLYYDHVATVLCRCPHLVYPTGLGVEWILSMPKVTSPASRSPRKMNGFLAHALLKPFMSETSLRTLTSKTSIPKGGILPTLYHLQYLVRVIHFYATLLMTSPSLASPIFPNHPLRSLRQRLCLLRLFLFLSQLLMSWSRFTEPLVFTTVVLVLSLLPYIWYVLQHCELGFSSRELVLSFRPVLRLH